MTVQPTARTILHRDTRRDRPAVSRRHPFHPAVWGVAALAEAVWRSRLWLATAALPLLAVLLLVVFHGVDAALPESSARATPTLELADLWGLRDGHRPLVPRLLVAALSLVGGDVLLAPMLSIALTLALAVALGRCLATEPRLALWLRRRRLGLVPLISILLFSFAQVENWTSEGQIRVFTSLFAFGAGVVLLLGPPQQRPRLLAAMLLGWIASYSFTSGLLYWIVLFPLAARPGPWREPRRTLWLSSVATCWLSFVPLAGETVRPLSWAPWRLVSFAATALGAPLFPHSVAFARLAGIAGACALFYFGVRLLGRTRGVRARAWLVAWLAIGGYAGGNALLTGLGRAHLGTERALAGSSLTVSLLLWVSLAVLALRWTENGNDPKLARRQWVVPVLLVATALLAWKSVDEAHRFKDRRRTRSQALIVPIGVPPATLPCPWQELRPAPVAPDATSGEPVAFGVSEQAGLEDIE